MKIGVALGGGGVRGLAHAVALEAIDGMGIVPAALAGTSMGAIIGAMYASGRSGREITESVEQHIITTEDRLADILRKRGRLVKWLKAVSPSWRSSGLFKADGFLHYLLDEIGVETFEDLKIPLSIATTDFHRGEPVVFSSGELMPAIRASMAIPGIFVPAEHEGRILVDGGVTDNLPYDLLPGDCDATIAVDVGPERKDGDGKAPTMVEATLGMFDTLIDKVTEYRLKHDPPTVYIRPRLTGIRTLDFEKAGTVLEQARKATDDFKSRLERVAKS
ncbi:MAG: patatin-like phospholipase family protein [Kiritimatiellia bacterium]